MRDGDPPAGDTDTSDGVAEARRSERSTSIGSRRNLDLHARDLAAHLDAERRRSLVAERELMGMYLAAAAAFDMDVLGAGVDMRP